MKRAILQDIELGNSGIVSKDKINDNFDKLNNVVSDIDDETVKKASVTQRLGFSRDRVPSEYAISTELENKADLSDLDNIVGGMINKGSVNDVSELANIANPERGWSYIVVNQKDANGNSYIYQYDGVKWNNTGLISYPSDLAYKKLDKFLFEIATDAVKMGELRSSVATSQYSWIPTVFVDTKSQLKGIRGYFDNSGTCILSIVVYGGNTGIPTTGNNVLYTVAAKYSFHVPEKGYNEIDLSELNIIMEEKSSFFIEKNSPVKICYGNGNPTGVLQFISSDTISVGTIVNTAVNMYVPTAGLSADWFIIPITDDVTKSDLDNELYDIQDTTNKPYVGIGTGTTPARQIIANNTAVEIDGYLVGLKYYIDAANREFYACALDRLKNSDGTDTNTFKIIDRVKVTSKQGGENIDNTLKLRVQKGQYIGYIQYAQSDNPNSRFPFYSASSDYAEGWWQGSITEIGNTAPLTFIEKASLSVGYKIELSKFLSRSELQQDIKTTTVTVQRNANNYSSIRETIASLNPDYYNRYIVFVPRGRWFECDLIGKEYIEIVGEDMYETVLYVDGNSTNLTPVNYSFGSEYANKPLNEVPQHLKHIFNARQNLSVKNLSMEANDAKYCVHLDNNGYGKASFVNCRMSIFSGVNYPVGIGIWSGQILEFYGCEFKRSTAGQGMFAHNWNNQNAPVKIHIENSRFTNCGFMTVDELGSDQNDEFNLINCYSDTGGGVIWMVDYRSDTQTTYWTNPATGTKEPNPQNVPYCIKLNCSGSNVGIVYSNNFPYGEQWVSRPDCLGSMITDYYKIWNTATVLNVGDCVQGYIDGMIGYYSKYSGSAPLIGVVVAVNGQNKYIVPRGKIAFTPVNGTPTTQGQHVKVNSSGQLEFTTDNNEPYVGLYVGRVNGVNKIFMI